MKFLNTYEKLLLELSMDPVISPSTTTGGANSTTTQTKKQSSVVPLWTRGTSIPSSHPPQQPLPAVPPPMYPRGLSSSASATTTTTSASASVLPLYTSQPPAIITRPFTNKNTPTVAKLESLMDEALAFPSVSLTSPVSTSTSPNSALFVSDEDEYSRDDGFDGIDGMVGWSGRNGILDDDDDEEYEDIVDEYVFEHIIQDEEEEDEGREYYRGGGLDSLPPPPPLMDRDAARTPSTLSSAPNTPSLGSYPAPIPFLGATDDFLGFPADEMDPHHPAHNMNKKRDGVVGLGFVDGVDEAHLHHHQQQLSHPPQQHWPNQTHHNNGKKHQNIRRMYSRVRRIIRGTSAPPATRGHHKRSLSVVSVSSSSGGVEVEAGGECAGSAGGVGRGVGGAKRTGFVGVASMPPPSRVPRGSMVTPRGMGYAREIEVVEVEIIPDPTSPKTTTPPSYASNSTSSTKALSTTTFIAGAPFAASVAASQHANQHHMAVAIEAVKAAAVAAASSSDASNNNNNSNSSNAGNVHRPSSTATSTSMRSSWSTIAGGNSAEVNEKKGPSSVTTKHKGGFSRMVSRVKKSVEAITGQHP
ncbi:hypothetical protein HK102_004596 [Quaeritorhiza haematococci]|nr:hypothetical protein HK102_004596 [Quaeritorhiza haematococci]